MKVDTVMDYAEHILRAKNNLTEAYNLMQMNNSVEAAVIVMEALVETKLAYNVIKDIAEKSANR